MHTYNTHAGYTEDYIEMMGLSEELGRQIQNQLSLKLMHFDDEKGRPSQVVSHLALAAYKAGADYFYQVNDDTVFKSKGKQKARDSLLIYITEERL